MSDEDKKDNSIEEQVVRISNNFESDILRLIKTQSMIKTSGGIINEEIEYLNTKTNHIIEKLNELNLKTNELSDLLQVSFQDKDLSQTHVGLYINEFIASIAKESKEIDSLKQELTDRVKGGSDKLNSLHQFYIAELEAFQQEVDSGLTTIHEDIKTKMQEELEPQPEPEPEPDAPPPSPTEETVTVNEAAEETESIENEEEYYQKMFASSNAQNGGESADDKFLYIALGFLLLCAVGFLGYYFKYIRPNTGGEMVILEELYKDKPPNVVNEAVVTDPLQNPDNIEKGELKPGTLPLEENTAKSDEYLISESGTVVAENPEGDFNHTIRVKRANVRSGPGRNYGVVSVLTYGNSVAMLDEQSGIWTKIRLADGKEGWVAKKLLSK